MDARLTGLPIDAGDSGDTRQQRLVLIAVGCSIAPGRGTFLVVRSRNIPAAQYGKAVSLESAGQTDRAIAEMKKAVELQPENVLAQLLVGDWLLLQNNPAAAIPYLEQARQLEPTPR